MTANFRWPVRVYYEDTDAGGVVYYANYLRFFERARTERLRLMGFEQDEIRQQDGVLFAVKSVHVDYKLPARFNDQLLVSADVVQLKRASVRFEQQIRSTQQAAAIHCAATVRIACVDQKELRPHTIPEAIYQRIKNDL